MFSVGAGLSDRLALESMQVVSLVCNDLDAIRHLHSKTTPLNQNIQLSFLPETSFYENLMEHFCGLAASPGTFPRFFPSRFISKFPQEVHYRYEEERFFTGKQFVHWLLDRQYASTLSEAICIGQECLKSGFFEMTVIPNRYQTQDDNNNHNNNNNANNNKGLTDNNQPLIDNDNIRVNTDDPGDVATISNDNDNKNINTSINHPKNILNSSENYNNTNNTNNDDHKDNDDNDNKSDHEKDDIGNNPHTEINSQMNISDNYNIDHSLNPLGGYPHDLNVNQLVFDHLGVEEYGLCYPYIPQKPWLLRYFSLIPTLAPLPGVNLTKRYHDRDSSVFQALLHSQHGDFTSHIPTQQVYRPLNSTRNSLAWEKKAKTTTAPNTTTHTFTIPPIVATNQSTPIPPPLILQFPDMYAFVSNILHAKSHELQFRPRPPPAAFLSLLSPSAFLTENTPEMIAPAPLYSPNGQTLLFNSKNFPPPSSYSSSAPQSLVEVLNQMRSFNIATAPNPVPVFGANESSLDDFWTRTQERNQQTHHHNQSKNGTKPASRRSMSMSITQQGGSSVGALDTFTGRDLIQYIKLKRDISTTLEAVTIANQLIAAKLIVHVPSPVDSTLVPYVQYGGLVPGFDGSDNAYLHDAKDYQTHHDDSENNENDITYNNSNNKTSNNNDADDMTTALVPVQENPLNHQQNHQPGQSIKDTTTTNPTNSNHSHAQKKLSPIKEKSKALVPKSPPENQNILLRPAVADHTTQFPSFFGEMSNSDVLFAVQIAELDDPDIAFKPEPVLIDHFVYPNGIVDNNHCLDGSIYTGISILNGLQDLQLFYDGQNNGQNNNNNNNNNNGNRPGGTPILTPSIPLLESPRRNSNNGGNNYSTNNINATYDRLSLMNDYNKPQVSILQHDVNNSNNFLHLPVTRITPHSSQSTMNDNDLIQSHFMQGFNAVNDAILGYTLQSNHKNYTNSNNPIHSLTPALMTMLGLKIDCDLNLNNHTLINRYGHADIDPNSSNMNSIDTDSDTHMYIANSSPMTQKYSINVNNGNNNKNINNSTINNTINNKNDKTMPNMTPDNYPSLNFNLPLPNNKLTTHHTTTTTQQYHHPQSQLSQNKSCKSQGLTPIITPLQASGQNLPTILPSLGHKIQNLPSNGSSSRSSNTPYLTLISHHQPIDSQGTPQSNHTNLDGSNNHHPSPSPKLLTMQPLQLPTRSNTPNITPLQAQTRLGINPTNTSNVILKSNQNDGNNNNNNNDSITNSIYSNSIKHSVNRTNFTSDSVYKPANTVDLLRSDWTQETLPLWIAEMMLPTGELMKLAQHKRLLYKRVPDYTHDKHPKVQKRQQLFLRALNRLFNHNEQKKSRNNFDKKSSVSINKNNINDYSINPSSTINNNNSITNNNNTTNFSSVIIASSTISSSPQQSPQCDPINTFFDLTIDLANITTTIADEVYQSNTYSTLVDKAKYFDDTHSAVWECVDIYGMPLELIREPIPAVVTEEDGSDGSTQTKENNTLNGSLSTTTGTPIITTNSLNNHNISMSTNSSSLSLSSTLPTSTLHDNNNNNTSYTSLPQQQHQQQQQIAIAPLQLPNFSSGHYNNSDPNPNQNNQTIIPLSPVAGPLDRDPLMNISSDSDSDEDDDDDPPSPPLIGRTGNTQGSLDLATNTTMQTTPTLLPSSKDGLATTPTTANNSTISSSGPKSPKLSTSLIRMNSSYTSPTSGPKPSSPSQMINFTLSGSSTSLSSQLGSHNPLLKPSDMIKTSMSSSTNNPTMNNNSIAASLSILNQTNANNSTTAKLSAIAQLGSFDNDLPPTTSLPIPTSPHSRPLTNHPAAQTTAIDFNDTGEFFAIGDRQGHITVVRNTQHPAMTHMNPHFKNYTNGISAGYNNIVNDNNYNTFDNLGSNGIGGGNMMKTIHGDNSHNMGNINRFPNNNSTSTNKHSSPLHNHHHKQNQNQNHSDIQALYRYQQQQYQNQSNQATRPKDSKYRKYCEFVSHGQDVDILRNTTIAPKINQIRFLPSNQGSKITSLLACNDKVIKLWRMTEVELGPDEESGSYRGFKPSFKDFVANRKGSFVKNNNQNHSQTTSNNISNSYQSINNDRSGVYSNAAVTANMRNGITTQFKGNKTTITMTSNNNNNNEQMSPLMPNLVQRRYTPSSFLGYLNNVDIFDSTLLGSHALQIPFLENRNSLLSPSNLPSSSSSSYLSPLNMFHPSGLSSNSSEVLSNSNYMNNSYNNNTTNNNNNNGRFSSIGSVYGGSNYGATNSIAHSNMGTNIGCTSNCNGGSSNRNQYLDCLTFSSRMKNPLLRPIQPIDITTPTLMGHISPMLKDYSHQNSGSHFGFNNNNRSMMNTNHSIPGYHNDIMNNYSNNHKNNNNNNNNHYGNENHAAEMYNLLGGGYISYQKLLERTPKYRLPPPPPPPTGPNLGFANKSYGNQSLPDGRFYEPSGHFEPAVRTKNVHKWHNYHDFNIHSLSLVSDGQHFISADDTKINLWSLDDESHIPLTLADYQAFQDDSLEHVITCVRCHPTDPSAFMVGSSNGCLRLCDIRVKAFNDNPISGPFAVFDNAAMNKEFLKKVQNPDCHDLLNAIHDIAFSSDGTYFFTRDYLSVKVWDSRFPSSPIQEYRIHDYTTPYIDNICESQTIFDQYALHVSRDNQTIYTGTYFNTFVEINTNLPNPRTGLPYHQNPRDLVPLYEKHITNSIQTLTDPNDNPIHTAFAKSNEAMSILVGDNKNNNNNNNNNNDTNSSHTNMNNNNTNNDNNDTNNNNSGNKKIIKQLYSTKSKLTHLQTIQYQSSGAVNVIDALSEDNVSGANDLISSSPKGSTLPPLVATATQHFSNGGYTDSNSNNPNQLLHSTISPHPLNLHQNIQTGSKNNDLKNSSSNNLNTYSDRNPTTFSTTPLPHSPQSPNVTLGFLSSNIKDNSNTQGLDDSESSDEPAPPPPPKQPSRTASQISTPSMVPKPTNGAMTTLPGKININSIDDGNDDDDDDDDEEAIAPPPPPPPKLLNKSSSTRQNSLPMNNNSLPKLSPNQLSPKGAYPNNMAGGSKTILPFTRESNQYTGGNHQQQNTIHNNNFGTDLEKNLSYFLQTIPPENIPLHHLAPQLSIFKLYNLPSATFITSTFFPATPINVAAVQSHDHLVGLHEAEAGSSTLSARLAARGGGNGQNDEHNKNGIKPYSHYQKQPTMFNAVAQQPPAYIIYSPQMRDTLIDHLHAELNISIAKATNIADYYLFHEASHFPDKSPAALLQSNNTTLRGIRSDFNDKLTKNKFNNNIVSRYNNKESLSYLFLGHNHIDKYDELTRQISYFGLDLRTIPSSSSLHQAVTTHLHPRYHHRFFEALRTQFRPLPSPTEYFQHLADVMAANNPARVQSAQPVVDKQSRYYQPLISTKPTGGGNGTNTTITTTNSSTSANAIRQFTPMKPMGINDLNLGPDTTSPITGLSPQARIFDPDARVQRIVIDAFSPTLLVANAFRLSVFQMSDFGKQLEHATKPILLEKVTFVQPNDQTNGRNNNHNAKVNRP